MAYQDISQSAAVMIREITATRAFFTKVGSFFRMFGNAMMVSASMQQRVDRVDALQRKSDAELAALNIKRDDIVQFVFRDLMYV